MSTLLLRLGLVVALGALTLLFYGSGNLVLTLLAGVLAVMLLFGFLYRFTAALTAALLGVAGFWQGLPEGLVLLGLGLCALSLTVSPHTVLHGRQKRLLARMLGRH
jgi:hypothetical protein